MSALGATEDEALDAAWAARPDRPAVSALLEGRAMTPTDLPMLLREAQAIALEDAALSGDGLLSEWQAGWLCERARAIRGGETCPTRRPPEDRTDVLLRILRDILTASADPRVATAGPGEITRPMRAAPDGSGR